MTTEEATAFLAGFVADWQRTPFQGITNESTDGQRLLEALRVVLDQQVAAEDEIAKLQRDLAELRTVRRCGLPGAHPAHGWFFARKILRCPGVEAAEAQTPAATAPEGSDGGPEGGLQRAGTAKADSDAGEAPKAPQNAPTGFCPECGTAQPLDHRGSITGHGAPDADCADWCGGSWNHPASAETTHQ